MTFHTQVVGANGQRQAMYIERQPGLAEVILSNFTVRAAGRDGRLQRQRADGSARRDGPRRPPPGVESHRGDERRAIDVRTSQTRRRAPACSTRRTS